MSQSNYKNELRTKVEGLDQLLNCDQYGLRWSKDEDLLIVIRGQRGIGKVDLAMMIMNGIAETSKSAELPRFYSLEKNAVRLTEQYGRNFNLTQEQLEKIFPCVDGKSPTYQGQRMARFSDIIGQLDKDIRSKVPCIVIDGFSSLTQQEMDRIPLAALECKLRQKATVAILLFGSNMDNVPTDVPSTSHTTTHSPNCKSAKVFSKTPRMDGINTSISRTGKSKSIPVCTSCFRWTTHSHTP